MAPKLAAIAAVAALVAAGAIGAQRLAAREPTSTPSPSSTAPEPEYVVPIAEPAPSGPDVRPVESSPTMRTALGAALPSAVARPVVAVGVLPADLIGTDPPERRPPIADSHAHGDEHGDDGAIAHATPDGIAATWTITRTVSRSDDPPDGRRQRLLALTSVPAVAAAADLAAPRATPAEGGATWAIVTAVDDLGAGWWQVSYTLKQTRTGQVGPASTSATLDVHVDDWLLVDGERP